MAQDYRRRAWGTNLTPPGSLARRQVDREAEEFAASLPPLPNAFGYGRVGSPGYGSRGAAVQQVAARLTAIQTAVEQMHASDEGVQYLVKVWNGLTPFSNEWNQRAQDIRKVLGFERSLQQKALRDLAAIRVEWSQLRSGAGAAADIDELERQILEFQSHVDRDLAMLDRATGRR